MNVIITSAPKMRESLSLMTTRRQACSLLHMEQGKERKTLSQEVFVKNTPDRDLFSSLSSAVIFVGMEQSERI